MATGYEVQMYENIKKMTLEMRRIADGLERVAKAAEGAKAGIDVLVMLGIADTPDDLAQLLREARPELFEGR